MEQLQYELPGMPEPGSEVPRDQAQEFIAAVRKYGPLVNVSTAARLLGVTDTAVNNVAARGGLTKLHLFGNSPFYVFSEIEDRLMSPRPPGRPKKVA